MKGIRGLLAQSPAIAISVLALVFAVGSVPDGRIVPVSPQGNYSLVSLDGVSFPAG